MKKPWFDLPESFLARLKTIVPDSSYQDILEALSSPRPTTLRANTLKTTASELIQALATDGFELTSVPWWENAFVLASKTLRELTDHPLYNQGHFYVQSLSSMIPPLVLNPQPNEKILDLTAAPGSKTTQIAALMNNTGSIVANDNSRIRIHKLKANLSMQGVTNTVVLNQHGETLWQHYPEYFDRVLADVPCSMEGRFCAIDPKSYEHWSTGKVKELAKRQKFLLRAALSAVKVGGTIVYSTCTLSPEENEGVIDWLLKKEKDTVELASISLPGLETTTALPSWNERIYDRSIIRTVRIPPSPLMEGFFTAKLIKTNSNIPSSLQPVLRKHSVY